MCGGYELEADPQALVAAFRVDAFREDLEGELGGLPHEHFPRMRGPIILTRAAASSTSPEHAAHERGEQGSGSPEKSATPTRWLGLSRWGLVPFWAEDLSVGDKLFNARAETLDSKPAFRDSFRQRRCVVPVSAFYEWRKAGRRSERFVFRDPDGQPLALAGLWSTWRAPSGERVGTYCVITVAPNALVAPIHNRMPAVLSPAQWERWLALDASPAELAAILRPADDGVLSAQPG
jgi:putative SOS response-associated peptidase YedK